MKFSVIHFRRCQICNTVNVQADRVLRCIECGKFVSPFFYFDDKDIRISEKGIDRTPFKGEYQPLIGISAYWPVEDIANTHGNR